eukprot:40607_1
MTQVSSSEDKSAQTASIFTLNHRKKGLIMAPRRPQEYYRTLVCLLKEKKSIFPDWKRAGGYKASLSKLSLLFAAAKPSIEPVKFTLQTIVLETCNAKLVTDQDFVLWRDSPQFKEYSSFIDTFQVEYTVFSDQLPLNDVSEDPMDEEECAIIISSIDFSLYNTQDLDVIPDHDPVYSPQELILPNGLVARPSPSNPSPSSNVDIDLTSDASADDTDPPSFAHLDLKLNDEWKVNLNVNDEINKEITKQYENWYHDRRQIIGIPSIDESFDFVHECWPPLFELIQKMEHLEVASKRDQFAALQIQAVSILQTIIADSLISGINVLDASMNKIPTTNGKLQWKNSFFMSLAALWGVPNVSHIMWFKIAVHVLNGLIHDNIVTKSGHYVKRFDTFGSRVLVFDLIPKKERRKRMPLCPVNFVCAVPLKRGRGFDGSALPRVAGVIGKPKLGIGSGVSNQHARPDQSPIVSREEYNALRAQISSLSSQSSTSNVSSFVGSAQHKLQSLQSTHIRSLSADFNEAKEACVRLISHEPLEHDADKKALSDIVQMAINSKSSNTSIATQLEDLIDKKSDCIASNDKKKVNKTRISLTSYLAGFMQSSEFDFYYLVIHSMRFLAGNYRFYDNKNRSSMLSSFFGVKFNMMKFIKVLSTHLHSIQNDMINLTADAPNRLILNWISLNLADLDLFAESINALSQDRSVDRVAFWYASARLFKESLSRDVPLSTLISQNIWRDKFKETNKFNNNLHHFLSSTFNGFEAQDTYRNNFHWNNRSNSNASNNRRSIGYNASNNRYRINNNRNNVYGNASGDRRRNASVAALFDSTKKALSLVGSSLDRTFCLFFLKDKCIKDGCTHKHICPICNTKHNLRMCPVITKSPKLAEIKPLLRWE